MIMFESFSHHLPVCISITHLSALYHNVSMFGKNVKTEAHTAPELFYIRECTGTHEILIGGRVHSLKSGQLIIVPPDTMHCNAHKNRSVADMIQFATDSDLSALYGKVLTLSAKQKQSFAELITIGVRLFTCSPPPGYSRGVGLHKRANAFELQKFKNRMELFLLDLYLAQFEPEASKRPNKELSSEEQFDRFVIYMNKNLDKPISLTEMADAFFVSTSTVQKLFYRFAGCAPMQYFLELKLSRAKEMLCTTSLNYTQISQMLGFSTVSYFSNFFKKRTGLSPSEYAATINESEL